MNSILTNREPTLLRLTMQLVGGDENFVRRKRISVYWHAPLSRERVLPPSAIFSRRWWVDVAGDERDLLAGFDLDLDLDKFITRTF